MKVAELDGTHLDYWVLYATMPAGVKVCGMPMPYSTSWEHGGPIIERERIVTFPDGQGGWASFVQENPRCGYVDTTACDEMRGPTYLVAAMRAYVASKFGDDVPDREE